MPLLTSSGIHLSSLNCDLVLVSPEYQYVVGAGHFSERQLFRAFALHEVASVDKVYVAPTPLKNPAHGSDRAILALGLAPVRGVLAIPEVDQSIERLRDPDTALFDKRWISASIFQVGLPKRRRSSPKVFFIDALMMQSP